MAKSTNQKGLSEDEIRKQIKELAEKANENTGKQLELLGDEFGDADIDGGFNLDILKDTANPEESHRLYYGIRRLLIDHLPKGHENKKLRQFIYNEKNLFLNRGIDLKEDGTRGSDGRQTYIAPFLVLAFSAITEWIKNGANPYDIYLTFYELNQARGYHGDKN